MQTIFYDLNKGDLINVSLRGVKFFNQNKLLNITFIVISDYYETYDNNLIGNLPSLLLFSETYGTMILQMKIIEETAKHPEYQYLTYRNLEGYASDDCVIESLEMMCNVADANDANA